MVFIVVVFSFFLFCKHGLVRIAFPAFVYKHKVGRIIYGFFSERADTVLNRIELFFFEMLLFSVVSSLLLRSSLLLLSLLFMLLSMLLSFLWLTPAQSAHGGNTGSNQAPSLPRQAHA